MFKRQGKFMGACLLAITCLTGSGQIAAAGTDDSALLEAVKVAASKGQNAQTASQVSQSVDQNQSIITAILQGYMGYLRQVQSMTDGGASAMPGNVQLSGSARVNTQAVNAPAAETPAAQAPGQAPDVSSATPQAPSAQPTGASQSAVIQPSSALQTSHLAGYPALPEVDPVSSVNRLSADQMEYALKVRRQNAARKAYLMQHPEGYTY